MKQRNNLTVLGILNLLLPLPMYLFTMLWGFWLIELFLGVLQYEVLPNWSLPILLLPLLFPPTLCLLGCIAGIKNRKAGKGTFCLLASVIGLLGNVLLFLLASWMGSTF